MKPKFQDYLTIVAALVAVFVSGYGIGYLLGEHRTAQRFENQTANVATDTPWQQTTLQRLDDRLQLTDTQKAKVAEEIAVTVRSLAELRTETVLESQRRILELQNRLEVHLDEDQRELIRKDREVLQQKVKNGTERAPQQ